MRHVLWQLLGLLLSCRCARWPPWVNHASIHGHDGAILQRHQQVARRDAVCRARCFEGNHGLPAAMFCEVTGQVSRHLRSVYAAYRGQHKGSCKHSGCARIKGAKLVCAVVALHGVQCEPVHGAIVQHQAANLLPASLAKEDPQAKYRWGTSSEAAATGVRVQSLLPWRSSTCTAPSSLACQ